MRLRPALLLVIASTVYAYLNPRLLTRTNVLTLWPMRLVATLGILACCSAVFGISLGGAATFLLDSYIKTLVYAFLIAVSIRHVRDLFTFVWAYVISCGILAFLALFVFGLSRTSSSDFARLSHLYAFDANDIGVVLMIGLPLAMLLMVVTRGSLRSLLVVIFVGMSATIARSGSRGGFLGLVAVCAVALFLVNSVSVTRRASIVIVAGAALLLGAPPGYWRQMSTVLEPKNDYNYSAIDGRKALAERGLGYLAKYPLFGLGINNFSRAECTISPKLETLKSTGPMRCTPPHNSYIQVGAELGVPGLIVWASLVLGVIFGLVRLRGRLPPSWRRGTDAERFLYGATTFFPLAMIGFAVTSFFVSFAWLDPIYIMAAFTAGLYVSLRVDIRERSGRESSSLASRRFVSVNAPGWRVTQSAERARATRSLHSNQDGTSASRP